MASLSAPAQLTVITWPRDARYRQELLAKQIPHLLLVEEGASPPDDHHLSEDWLRLPAPPGELEARLAALRQRASLPVVRRTRPELGDDGLLRTDRGWVALSAGEVQLMNALLAHFGEPTSLAELEGDEPASARSRAVRVRVMRLRRKIAPVGLKIVTLRQLGYVLENE